MGYKEALKDDIGSRLVVGQTVWLQEISHRVSNDKNLIEAKVTSVGRKYFQVDPKWYGRFYVDSLLHDAGNYSPRYKVYLSKKQYEESIEIQKLSTEIRNKIGQYGTINLPIEKLRAISELLC